MAGKSVKETEAEVMSTPELKKTEGVVTTSRGNQWSWRRIVPHVGGETQGRAGNVWWLAGAAVGVIVVSFALGLVVRGQGPQATAANGEQVYTWEQWLGAVNARGYWIVPPGEVPALEGEQQAIFAAIEAYLTPSRLRKKVWHLSH